MNQPSSSSARPYAGGVPIVEVIRSGFLECQHLGSIAVLDADGKLATWWGDPHGAIFPRSSNKPIQAAAMLRNGLRLADAGDLALVAGSHWGEQFHVDRVQAMLRSVGLTEEHLRCPPDLPVAEPARVAVLRAGGGPSRLQMNCSGKHAGMLLTCVAAGWPVENYVAVEHPVQEACRRVLVELAEEEVAAAGVDGCGAAVMAISLTGLARAVLKVCEAEPGSPERTVADAMRAHPECVSGTDSEEVSLYRGVTGILVKGGAEGVGVAALPGVGAVAVKVDDGAGRARLPALVLGLRRLGLTEPVLDQLGESPVWGGGERVGSVVAAATMPSG